MKQLKWIQTFEYILTVWLITHRCHELFHSLVPLWWRRNVETQTTIRWSWTWRSGSIVSAAWRNSCVLVEEPNHCLWPGDSSSSLRDCPPTPDPDFFHSWSLIFVCYLWSIWRLTFHFTCGNKIFILSNNCFCTALLTETTLFWTTLNILCL